MRYIFILMAMLFTFANAQISAGRIPYVDSLYYKNAAGSYSKFDFEQADPNVNLYSLKEEDSPSELQATLNSVSGKSGNQILELDKGGNYSIGGNILKVQVDSALTILGNGATLIGTGNASYLEISFDTTNSTFYYTGFSPSEIVTNPVKGTNYIDVDDTTDWKPIREGDIITISDSTKYRDSGGTAYYRSIQGYFDRFGDDGGGTQRIYFKNKLQNNLDRTKIFYDGSNYKISKIRLADRLNIENLFLQNFSISIRGFENVNLSNITAINDVTPDAQHTYAVELRQVRRANLSNMIGENWLKSGLGYFISMQIFENINISNLIAYDCRHAITTNSNLHNINGRLNVSNSQSSFSEDLADTYPNWDTHGQTEEIILNNVIAERGASGIQVRANKASITGLNARDLAGPAVTIVHTTNSEEKPYVSLKNSDVEAEGVFATFDSVWVQKIDISGITFRPRGTLSNQDAIQIRGASQVDTLAISNSRFEGSLTNTSSDGATWLKITASNWGAGRPHAVKYANIRGNEFEDYYRIVELVNGSEIYSLDFKGNDVQSARNVLMVDNTGADTTTADFNRWEISNNEFRDVYRVYDGGSEFARYKNLIFSNNRYQNVAFSDLVYQHYLERLEYTDNIYNNFAYDDSWSHRIYGGYSDSLIFVGNKYMPHNDEDIDNVNSAKGYGSGNVDNFNGWLRVEKTTGFKPYVLVSGNEYYQKGNLSNEIAYFDSLNLQFIDNKVMPEKVNDDAMILFDDINGDVLNNTFSTQFQQAGRVIELAGSGDIRLQGNEFSIDPQTYIVNLVFPQGSYSGSLGWSKEISPLNWRAKLDGSTDERVVFKNLTSQTRRTGGIVNFPPRDTLFLGTDVLIDSAFGSNTIVNFNESVLRINRIGGIFSSSINEVTKNQVYRDGTVITSPPDQLQSLSYAFNFKSDSSLFFENMRFKTHGAGLDFDDDCYEIRIDNCYFGPDDSVGIGNLNIGDGAEDVRITNSVFQGSSNGWTNQIPLNYKGLGPVYIANNEFGYNDFIVGVGDKGGKSVLIELTNDNGADSQLVFIGNTIDPQGIFNVENPVPDSQHIHGAAFQGVSRAIISNNYIRGDTTGSPGQNIGLSILASDENAATRNIIVNNNRIENFYGGIRLALVKNSLFGDFDFNNNSIEGCPTYAYQLDLAGDGVIGSETYDSLAYINIDGGTLKKSGYIYIVGDGNGNGDGLISVNIKNITQVDTVLDGNLIRVANPGGIFISVENNILDQHGILFDAAEFSEIDHNTSKWFTSSDIHRFSKDFYVATGDTAYVHVGGGFMPIRAVATALNSVGATSGAFDIIFVGQGATHNLAGTHAYPATATLDDTLRYVMSDFITNSLALTNLETGVYYGFLLVNSGTGTGGGKVNVTLDYLKNTRD